MRAISESSFLLIMSGWWIILQYSAQILHLDFPNAYISKYLGHAGWCGYLLVADVAAEASEQVCTASLGESAAHWGQKCRIKPLPTWAFCLSSPLFMVWTILCMAAATIVPKMDPPQGILHVVLSGHSLGLKKLLMVQEKGTRRREVMHWVLRAWCIVLCSHSPHHQPSYAIPASGIPV